MRDVLSHNFINFWSLNGQRKRLKIETLFKHRKVNFNGFLKKPIDCLYPDNKIQRGNLDGTAGNRPCYWSKWPSGHSSRHWWEGESHDRQGHLAVAGDHHGLDIEVCRTSGQLKLIHNSPFSIYPRWKSNALSLTHKAHVVNCSWESYRLKETLNKSN